MSYVVTYVLTLKHGETLNVPYRPLSVPQKHTALNFSGMCLALCIKCALMWHGRGGSLRDLMAPFLVNRNGELPHNPCADFDPLFRLIINQIVT